MHLYLLLLSIILSGCQKPNLEAFRKLSVSDGDTLTVSRFEDLSKIERVRLLGIDTPELSQDPWGKNAKEFLENELEDDDVIYLEIYGKDKYERLLAYLYDKNKVLINSKILKNGYAVLFLIDSRNEHHRELKDAELYAREKKLNIWDDNQGLKQSPYDYRSKNRKKEAR